MSIDHPVTRSNPFSGAAVAALSAPLLPGIKARWLIWLVLVASMLGGCAGTPTRHLQNIAQKGGFQETVVESAGFDHRVYRNKALQSLASQAGAADSVGSRPISTQQGRQLNVYLEGDGMPWMLRYVVMADPTPRQPLMLQMMRLDRSPAIYVGRPCYNGFATAEGCDPTLWTSARYSQTVVNSMAGVIKLELARQPFEQINLFGHSGGGALAMLLAEQLPQTRTIVTLAGNLDIDAWTDHHNYSRLFTSLNPALRPVLPTHIRQVHLIGARDSNIPPSIVKPWIFTQRNSYGVVFEQFDHSCCWKKFWPGFLRQVANREKKAMEFSAKPFHRPALDLRLSETGLIPETSVNTR